MSRAAWMIEGRFPHGIPAIIGLASNIRGGPNPPFGLSDFAEMYPQFFIPPEEPDEPEDPENPTEPEVLEPLDGPAEPELTPVIPLVMMEILIELAHACVKHSRFRTAWKFCMGLFIAHFVTLYLKTMAEPGADPYYLAKAGETGGNMSSKSVDGVSVGYDFSSVADDLEGWAEWKATEFGVQLATFAKMFSKGGMYIR